MTLLGLLEKVRLETEAARALQETASDESRDLTEEEAETFDKHLKEARKCEILAARLKKLEEQETRLTKPEEKKVPLETASGSRIDVSVPLPGMYSHGKLRAFRGEKANRDAYYAGKWLQATILDDAEARQWCRDHNVEMRVQTEGINSAGGFVVPSTMETAIINLREEYGSARRNARVVPMTSDHTTIPRRAGGVTAYFVGETDDITESDMSWNQVELTAKELGCLTRISASLNEDGIINVADTLAGEMALAFATKEDLCAIDGTGLATHGGMIGIRTKMVDGLHVGSYIEAEAAGDEWDEIDAADLLNMMGALPMYARRGAKWHCSPLAKVAVFDRLIMAAGGATMTEQREGNRISKYMGYPIEEWSAMPTVDQPATTLNALIMLFFGDYSMAASLGSRRGITIAKSVDRYFEYNQIAIRATERFCINNHDIGGLTAATRGPVVGLLGNT